MGSWGAMRVTEGGGCEVGLSAGRPGFLWGSVAVGLNVRLSEDQIRGQRFVADDRKGGLGEGREVLTECRVGF